MRLVPHVVVPALLIGLHFSAAQGTNGPSPKAIANIDGIVLGEFLPARHELHDCVVVDHLSRCPLPAAAREETRVLIDGYRVVHALEIRTYANSSAACETERQNMLSRLQALHGEFVEAIFDAWNWRGVLWEQELEHRFPVRGLSLSECRSTPGRSGWYFERAYGVSEPEI